MYVLYITGGIPYTAHGSQIPPPLYFLFFLIFDIMLRLGLPRRVEKRYSEAPAGLVPPAGARKRLGLKIIMMSFYL